MSTINLLAAALGIGFVSGLRLYATVLVIGVSTRMGWLHIAQRWSGLEVLGHPAVITVAAIAFLAEFFADKVPWVDSAWDFVHSIVRPIGAAYIAAKAFGATSERMEVICVLLAGGVALASHASKASARLLLNHSPEPATNVVASFTEDLTAMGGIVLVLTHPLIAGAIVLLFLLVVAWLAPKFWRLLKREVETLRGWRQKWRQRFAATPVPAAKPR